MDFLHSLDMVGLGLECLFSLILNQIKRRFRFLQEAISLRVSATFSCGRLNRILAPYQECRTFMRDPSALVGMANRRHEIRWAQSEPCLQIGIREKRHLA